MWTKKLYVFLMICTMAISCVGCSGSFVKVETIQDVVINDMTITYKNVFEYDSEGNLSENRVYQDGVLQSISSVVEKDENGNPSVVHKQDASGTVNEIVRTTYENGLEAKIEYETNGVIYQTTTVVYDDSGRILSSENSLANGNILSKTVYGYDENGFLQHITRDFQEAGTILEVYEYDSNGRTAKITVYEGSTTDTSVREYIEYTYNEDDRTCTRVTIPVNNTIGSDTTVITYDEYGNEIMSESFADGVLYNRLITKWKREK